MINIADEKPPNGLIRRDSFNDSDSEFDEPFFNFDSEEIDAEERYSEALMDELKKLQVWLHLFAFSPSFLLCCRSQNWPCYSCSGIFLYIVLFWGQFNKESTSVVFYNSRVRI